MRKTVLGLLILLALARVSAAAAPPWQQVLDRGKRDAARLAAAGKWKPALRKIQETRAAVEDASKQELRALQRPTLNPAYRKEREALDQWARTRGARVGGDANARKALLQEYTAKRKALKERYASQNRKLLSQLRGRQLAVRARADLAVASLDDLAATYVGRSGGTAQATFLRQSALVGRLRAYQALGRIPQAVQAANALLALGSRDPAAYSAAGEFFGEQKQYERAAKAWRQGIQLLESGRAATSRSGGRALTPQARNHSLGEFYRQLAFCYSQLGKRDDALRLLDRANKLDTTPGGRPAPRR